MLTRSSAMLEQNNLGSSLLSIVTRGISHSCSLSIKLKISEVFLGYFRYELRPDKQKKKLKRYNKQEEHS